MSSDLSKVVVAAFIVVVLAAIVLGMVIGYDLKPASTPVSGTAKYADVTLVVQSDLTLGPDNQTHDTFVPCNFTVYAGQIVNLTVVNYDNAPHSFTSPTLNVAFQIPGKPNKWGSSSVTLPVYRNTIWRLPLVVHSTMRHRFRRLGNDHWQRRATWTDWIHGWIRNSSATVKLVTRDKCVQ